MDTLLKEIRSCTLCKPHLSHEPRPIVAGSPKSCLLIIGQAPGRRVHESGIPWDDASGRLLREWMGITSDQFYDPDVTALLPMGFCYPGKGKSGDLPPRQECAPAWHERFLKNLKNVKLTIFIGQYAQRHYLTETINETLTHRVRGFNRFLPTQVPLPHPSPRNRLWLKKNPWFDKELLPVLQKRIQEII